MEKPEVKQLIQTSASTDDPNVVQIERLLARQAARKLSVDERLTEVARVLAGQKGGGLSGMAGQRGRAVGIA